MFDVCERRFLLEGCVRMGFVCVNWVDFGFCFKLDSLTMLIEDTVAAVIERLTTALRVAGLIPALSKYLYGLQVVAPG